MRKNDKKFYLGLDIGTDSIGWAVTDENYKLLRNNGKSLWGVRLFNDAQTAATRRGYRVARRRLERRRERIALLQSLFEPLIAPIDPAFYRRLDESNLYLEDKRCGTRFSLFADTAFTDRDFHHLYPTVYHLRAAMMHTEDPDPRLVYLALHHMIKYRGHFLLEGDDLSQVEDVQAPVNGINEWLVEHDRPALSADESGLRAALEKPKAGERKDALRRLLCVSDSFGKALVDMLAGNKVGAEKLFDYIDKEENLKIDFKEDWDTLCANVQERLGDDFALIEYAKNLYDYGNFKRLLGSFGTISSSMVAKYDKHNADLALLKKVVKEYYTREQYEEVFRAPRGDVVNYTVYSGKYDFGPRGTAPDYGDHGERSSRTAEDFYKFLRKFLSANQAAMNDERVKGILADMDNGTFMPKQVSKANAVLPYQCNLMEMRAILDNVCAYPRYAYLLSVDDDGVSVCDKIRSLLCFHMPYYVGPINNHSGRYWVVRRRDGKVYPWNVGEMIDLPGTEQRFIERMTNDCPYIPGAKVLPRCSLLYEEAAFLNVINKIKVNGAFLDAPLKEALSRFFAVPSEGKVISKLSVVGLKNWLFRQGVLSSADRNEAVVSGIDQQEGIVVNRRTYAQLCKIMGGEAAVEAHRALLEQVILWATIAGPEKSNLRKRLHAFSLENDSFLSDVQIKRIVGLTFNGWGRYSERLLLDRLGTHPYTGEVRCVGVIDLLRETNDNLSEILKSDRYGVKIALEELQPTLIDAIRYDDIDDLYCSPAVKKQIWQSIQVVAEIKRVVGDHPLKVFVEVARGDDPRQEKLRVNKRNLDRKRSLVRALAALERDRKELFHQGASIEDVSPKELQKNKLYLYFMQNGLDAYTGEPIDYNNLSAYDRDHIYPRSKIKDDSVHDNLVLTSHLQNVRKADVFPLPREVQQRMTPYWTAWLKAGLITQEKYKRLTSREPLDADECADFINRQLVETRQSTKEVCKLLKRMFPDSEIVYSKARLVSDFRQGVCYAKDAHGDVKQSFVKVRELNDIHHAKDAYLNIVVGNVYNTTFGHDARVYFGSHNVDHFALDHLFLHAVGGAWVPGEEGTILRVRKTMANNAILFTRESYIKRGDLFDATLYRKKETGLTPIKQGKDGKFAAMSDTAKYGGYNNEKRGYYMLVRHTKGGAGRFVYTLVGVLARFVDSLRTDVERLAYCHDLGYTDPAIIIPCIKIDAMFEINGTPVTLSGMTGERIVWKLAVQNILPETLERYCKKVYNVVEKYHLDHDYLLDCEDGIDEQSNLELYDQLVHNVSSARYSGLQSLRSFSDTLQSVRGAFIDATPMDQCILLTQIMRALKCNSQPGDLSLVGKGKNMGLIRTSNTFDETQTGIYLVYRSAAGLFEKKVPLIP